MIAFFYGGSASGKSELAEQLVVSLPSPRLYIATLHPFDDESDERIEKHRRRRSGLGMRTAECYGDLREVGIGSDDMVMLECLGNLTDNLFYRSHATGEEACQAIIASLDHVFDHARDAVVVGNDVFTAGEASTPEMQEYLGVLGRASRHAAKRADLVVEVVYGIPIVRRGDAALVEGLSLEMVRP